MLPAALKGRKRRGDKGRRRRRRQGEVHVGGWETAEAGGNQEGSQTGREGGRMARMQGMDKECGEG